MDILSLFIGAISGGAIVAFVFTLNRKTASDQTDVSFYKIELENAKAETAAMRVRVESLIDEKATTKAALEATYKTLES